MKRISFIILSVFLITVSCEKNEEKYETYEENVPVTFAFQKIDAKSSEQTSVDDISMAIITVENSQGEVEYENYQLIMYKFGNNFTTEPISLKEGEYKLTEYLLADSKGIVLYATPKLGSEMAKFVNNPLSIIFDVKEDKTNNVVPEVIRVEEKKPEDFGYATFSFDLVEIIDFLISAFAYDSRDNSFQLTNAELKVDAGNEEMHKGAISAQTNHIKVKGGRDTYEISVSKSNYKTYNETFSAEELKNHFTNPIEALLEEK